MASISIGVFDRYGKDEISERSFYGFLGAFLIWGLLLTAFVAEQTLQMGYAPGILGVIFLGLCVPILGIIIAKSSENPILSFLGYNMVIVPFGVIISPILHQYSPDVIRNVFGMTAGITLVMGLSGIAFPKFFAKIGGALFIALFGLLLVRIVQVFIPGLNFSIIDYIAAAIFSLYIGYDMYRASEVAKTVDNAVDIAIDLYLDVINLFLTLLRINSSDD